MDIDVTRSLAADTQEFSTITSPIGERARKWRDHLAEVYFGLEVQSSNPDLLNGGLLKRSLPRIRISELRGSTQRMIRTAELAKHDNVESYVFIAPLNGLFEYTDPRIRGQASPGQLFALASADPHEVAISDNARMVCLEIPAQLLTERAIRMDHFREAGVFTDPLVSSLFRTTASSILHCDTEASIRSIEKTCLDIIETATAMSKSTMTRGSDSRILDDAIFDRFVQVISRNFCDHNFDLSKCAAACGVSKRHLQAVMQARNTCFSREIQKTRLAEADRLIRSSRRATAVGQIAAMCGFASQAYFSTCYRRHYGISPRDARFA